MELNSVDHCGDTALVHACARGHLQIAELLLEAEAGLRMLGFGSRAEGLRVWVFRGLGFRGLGSRGLGFRVELRGAD